MSNYGGLALWQIALADSILGYVAQMLKLLPGWGLALKDALVDGHLLLYTLSHVEPSGNAPVRPGYNELTLQLAMAACHVQRPN
jgi:hypothetical protein